MPLVLFVWTLARRDWFALVVSLAVLLLGWPQTDLNIRALVPRPPAQSTVAAIRVFNWNTRFWNEEHDAGFYSFLLAQNADVYQLQEYWDRNGRALDLRPELEKALPGYQIAISDDLVTASRLPILAQQGDVPGRFLRVDVRAGDQPVSFYNVHISMQLGADMAGIFHNRQVQFSRLQDDLARNVNSAYISGDFNSTTSMGVMRWLLGHYQDSVQAGAAFIPRTWAFHLLPELRLWRLDFNLVDPRLAVIGYQDIDPGASSDHWAQLVQIGYTAHTR